MLRYIMAVVLFLTVFTGCAQKTNIKAIKAGKVNDSDIRSIAVLRFQNDSIGQSDIISSKVVNHTIDGKKYFQVASRKDLNVVLNEKKLNDSGLVDIDNTKSSGLTQVKTLLLGRVLDIGSSYSYYRKDVKTDSCRSYAKTKKGKSYCKEYYTRTIACKTQNYTLSTNVKLVKVRNSKILFSKNYSAKDKKNHCENDSKILPDKYQMASKLAKTVADDLLLDIAPSYTNFSVGLLDDPDTNYSSKSTGLLNFKQRQNSR
ncbi:MAG: hypothetical protein B1H07_04035 [Campylobacteraceae bacterium 4484_166]|nr:MAG: hypothetical protein B1H07_04035 [Campylobacteraceae bacterium 4484_166]